VTDETREIFLRRILPTLAGGVLGGAVFWLLGLPAPWLSGAMVGMVGVIRFGVEPYLPSFLRDVGMLLAGIVTGSAITPEMIGIISRYPASLVGLALTTWVIVQAGRATLTRGFGWDRETAFFASVPGALSVVIATAATRKVDMLRVAAIQAFRLFVLIAVLPSVVILSAPRVDVAPAPLLSAPAFAWVCGLGVVIALLFERFGVMAPFLLGGMVATGGLHVAGFVVGTTPDIVAGLAMLLVGIFAGSRFSALDGASLRALALPGIAVFLVTSAIAALGSLIVAFLIGLPLGMVLVAYAPGGLEAMVLLGLALGLDPLYVTAHHVGRFVMIAAALPFIARRNLDGGP